MHDNPTLRVDTLRNMWPDITMHALICTKKLARATCTDIWMHTCMACICIHRHICMLTRDVSMHAISIIFVTCCIIRIVCILKLTIGKASWHTCKKVAYGLNYNVWHPYWVTAYQTHQFPPKTQAANSRRRGSISYVWKMGACNHIRAAIIKSTERASPQPCIIK